MVMAALEHGRNTSGVRKAYTSLVESGERLSAEELAIIMETLSRRTYPPAFTLLERLWNDLETHGVTPSERHYSAMITGLATHLRVSDALSMVDSVLDAGMEIDPAALRAVVAAAGLGGDAKVIDTAIEAARRAGHLDERMYAAVLEQRAERMKGTWADAESLLARMSANGAVPGPWVQIQLVAIAGRDSRKAKEIVDSWRPNEIEDEELQLNMWNTLIHVNVAQNDPAAVEAALRRAPDVKATPAAVVYLILRRLQPSYDSADVLQAIGDVTRATGRQPLPAVWTRLISEVLTADKLETAWELYQTAKAYSGVMTFELAQKFINKLCAPSPPHFEQAIEVHDDLASQPFWIQELEMDVFDTKAAAIYDTLLRAATRTATSSTAIALELAEKAKQRGLKYPPADLKQLMLGLMKAARDHPDAFDVFERLYPLLGESFTQEQFNSIITTYIALQYPNSTVPPAEYVVPMLHEMRRAGLQPGAHILTSLLKSYATLSKKNFKKRGKLSMADQDFVRNALMSATNDVHHLLRLDPLVNVDVPLLTALMDALSSARAFEEAMDVWVDIVRRRKELATTMSRADLAALYAPAISVALDTCGYADFADRARKIWTWAQRHHLARDARVWAAYIECMARTGSLNAALDMCVQMASGAKGVPKVNKDIVAIVVKFSWRSPKQIAHISERVRREFPQWADELEEITRVL